MMMKFHDIAGIFPMMSEHEFNELKSDITVNGLREPIVVYGDKIIDGRNRYKACKELGIEPKFCLFNPEIHGDPIAFVASLNLQRRHLNSSQKAMVAANIATLKQGHKKTDENQITQTEAAQHLGISEHSIFRATKVKRNGIPELEQAVMDGKMAVSKAYFISEAPKDQQSSLMDKPLKEIKSYRAEKTEMDIQPVNYDLIFIEDLSAINVSSTLPLKNDSIIVLSIKPAELVEAIGFLKAHNLTSEKTLICHSKSPEAKWTKTNPTYCLIAYKNIISEAFKDLPDAIISDEPTASFIELLSDTPIGSLRAFAGDNPPPNWEVLSCK